MKATQGQFAMLFKPFFQTTTIPIALVDFSGRIQETNPAMQILLGFPAEEIEGRNLLEFVAAEDVPATQALFRNMVPSGAKGPSTEIRCLRRDGQKLTALAAFFKIHDQNGDQESMILTLENLSDSRQAQQRFNDITYFDPLTGLANRLLLHDRLEHALTQAKRAQGMIALLMININRFRDINDSFGHAAGDQLLNEVSNRLRPCFRDSDTLARFNGDKFAIVLDKMPGLAPVSLVLRKLLERLGKPFSIGEQDVFITSSIGIALSPGDGKDSDSLLNCAELAMARASKEGRNNYQFYTTEMNARARERLRLESSLYRALERSEFELYYQPQIHPANGKMLGTEALLRWNHPTRGLLGPEEFVPMLEETGLIHAAGRWVLHTACAQAKAWRSAGFPEMRIAVNISARQLLHRNFAEEVAHALQQSGLEGEALDLEITESILMEDTELNAEVLQKIAGLGVHISIDDFGTGYSPLTYLKRFPVHSLKIDRSFIQGIPENSDDMAIAFSIFALAETLGLQVTAEGVETAQQLSTLNNWQCNKAQGYLFARPMPAARLDEWHSLELPQLRVCSDQSQN